MKLVTTLRPNNWIAYFFVVILSWSFFDETSSLRSSTDAARPCAAHDSNSKALNFILANFLENLQVCGVEYQKCGRKQFIYQ